MPVGNHLELTTEHLPRAELARLASQDEVRVIEFEDGAWVRLPGEPGFDFMLASTRLQKDGFEALQSCLWRARQLQCQWILFDAGAPADEQLPVYDS